MKRDKIALISLLSIVPMMVFNPLVIKNKQMPLIRETEGIEIDFKQELDFRNVIHKQVLVSKEVEIGKVVETEVVVVEEVIEVEEEIVITPTRIPVMLEVSFYDSCTLCTPGLGITASGKQVEYGMVALPKDIPFGTKVHIPELGTFVNEDTGSFIEYTEEGYMRIDVYVESHEKALELGRYVIEGEIEY